VSAESLVFERRIPVSRSLEFCNVPQIGVWRIISIMTSRITTIVENGAEEAFWKIGHETIRAAIHIAVAAMTL
jgi:hypothetical protein